jgi:ABC-type dipeptide/oligopeptide/nickel transport system permease component
MNLLSNLPAVITAVLAVAFLAFTGARLGLSFLVRRLAGLVFVLFATSFLTFYFGLIAPVNAIDSQLGDKWTLAKAQVLYAKYGLTDPWYTQYYNYVTRLLHGNLGISYVNPDRHVADVIARQLPNSLLLGLSAAVLAVTVGIGLGLLAGIRANTRYDTGIQVFALAFFALPTFVLIPLYQVLVVLMHQHGLPTPPLSSTDFGLSHLDQYFPPVILFAVVQLAAYARLTRTSLLEVLRQDYVRTARAKGLGERAIIWGHAFRNAMIPIITAVGPALAFLVNGAFVTESLFNIQGIGLTTISAITENDFPLLQATVIMLAVAVVFFNLITDVLYGVVDPRIKSA